MHSPTPAAHLRIDAVSKRYGARRVLTDVSLTVGPEARVGLIGENGSGKSTLLRIAGGLTEADSGAVTATARGSQPPRIGLLHQEPPFAPGDTIGDALAAATAPVLAALAEIDRAALALSEAPEDANAAEVYASALDEAERLGAWELESRVASVLAGLGLAGLPHDRPTRELSGGQRARLSLAWMLLNAPDVLLLDEPTNHLDDQAADYLSRLLATWAGPVLFASHDRAFLDGNATALVDLDPAQLPHAATKELVEDGTGSGIGITRFTGSYTDYLAHRRTARERWERQYAEEQAEIARLRAGISENQIVGHVDWKPRTETRMAQKFYGDRNARVVARRVNDVRARLAEAEASQIRKPPPELHFAGIPGGRTVGLTAPVAIDGTDAASANATLADQASGPAIGASELAIPGRLAPITLSVSAGEHWLITGTNGAGKSTLLRAIAGAALPARASGGVWVAPGASVGILEQETVFSDPSGRGDARTARETYADGVGIALADAVSLGNLGLLPARDENRPIGTLSVGQRRRLALAILLADPPEILLLDEPTNHLSLLLAEALEEAVADYPGTVLIASHDRWLRSRWQGETVHLEPAIVDLRKL